MRCVSGSLANGVLAEAILIPPRPYHPPIKGREGVVDKSTEASNTKTIY